MTKQKEAETSFVELQHEVIKVLETIYDPEIPVNIYEMGLVYEVEVNPDKEVNIVMTLTTPNCPVAESLPEEVKTKAAAVPGVKKVNLELVFDPPWEKEMMSEAARLELGLL